MKKKIDRYLDQSFFIETKIRGCAEKPRRPKTLDELAEHLASTKARHKRAGFRVKTNYFKVRSPSLLVKGITCPIGLTCSGGNLKLTVSSFKETLEALNLERSRSRTRYKNLLLTTFINLVVRIFPYMSRSRIFKLSSIIRRKCLFKFRNRNYVIKHLIGTYRAKLAFCL